MNKFQKAIAKLLFGSADIVNKDLPDGMIVYNEISNLTSAMNNEIQKLYDFVKSYKGTVLLTPADVVADTPYTPETAESNGPKVNNLNDNTTKLSPKDVYEELDRVPDPVNIDEAALDQRIGLLKRKMSIGIDNRYTKDEMQGMLDCLERRYKYQENSDFFGKFAYTTQTKINEFLEKYSHLTMKESTLFVPTFPEDAITIMEDYTEKVKELFNKAPVFYVIAKKDEFQKKDKKNDPILLVQSPFGFFWQILGAWDEEMLLLEEL